MRYYCHYTLYIFNPGDLHRHFFLLSLVFSCGTESAAGHKVGNVICTYMPMKPHLSVGLFWSRRLCIGFSFNNNSLSLPLRFFINIFLIVLVIGGISIFIGSFIVFGVYFCRCVSSGSILSTPSISLSSAPASFAVSRAIPDSSMSSFNTSSSTSIVEFCQPSTP